MIGLLPVSVACAHFSGHVKVELAARASNVSTFFWVCARDNNTTTNTTVEHERDRDKCIGRIRLKFVWLAASLTCPILLFWRLVFLLSVRED